MNTEKPFDIVSAGAISKLPKEVREKYTPLTDKEHNELRYMNRRARRAWLSRNRARLAKKGAT